MIRVVCIAAFFLTSCTVPVQAKKKNPILVPNPICNIPAKVFIDVSAPPIWRAYMAVGVNWWNRTVGKDVLVYKGTADLSGFKKNNEPEYVAAREANEKELLEWPKRRNGFAIYRYKIVQRTHRLCLEGTVILVRNDGKLKPGRTFLVLLHELGHAVGLHHSDQKHSIMHEHVTKKTKMELCPTFSKLLERLY